MRSGSFLSTVLLSVAAPLGAAPVMAQEVSAALEEIVVTARKRQESLQDVPIAITAYSGATLKEKGVQNTTELFAQVPNVVFRKFGINNPAPIIRGFLSGPSDATTESSTAFYVDGVYIAAAGALDMKLLDVERVEVLRGPQGTLYGKNAIGGSVNIITRKPSNEFSADGTIIYGNHDLIDAAMSVSSPLIEDKLFARLSGALRKSDPFLYNDVLGRGVEHDDYKGALLSIHARPSEPLRMDLSIDVMRSRPSTGNTEAIETSVQENCRARPAGSAAPTASCPAPLAGNPFFAGFGYDYNAVRHDGVLSSPIESLLDQQGMGAGLTVTYDLEGHEVVSVSGYRDYEVLGTQPRGFSAYPLLDRFSQEFKSESHSQELRISSTGEGPLQYVAGVYGFKDQRDLFMDTGSLPPARPGLFAAGPGLPIFLNLFQETTALETSSYAVFGQANYEITPALKLTLGGRYTWEKRSITLISNCDGFNCPYFVYAPGGAAGVAAGVPPQLQSDTSREQILTPLMSLAYDITDDAMIYATASKGFKSGGYSPVFTFSVRPFERENAWNYEAGFKTNWFDKRLSANLAAFYTRWTDVQVSAFTVGSGFQVQNAARVMSKGVELELAAVVSDGLQLGASYGYLDSSYDMPLDPTSVTANLRRHQLPEHSLSTHVAYIHPLSATWDFALRADHSYKGGLVVRGGATDQVTAAGIRLGRVLLRESYGVLNARAGIQSDRLGLHLWAKNLTDEHYYTAVTLFDGAVDAGAGMVGEPRTYGVELSAKF